MNVKSTLNFLTDLKANNHREWFQENKKRYDQIKEEMLEFLARLIPQMAEFDTDLAMVNPKDCLFRIYRDVRFSHDKSPYKTHIGAFISKTGIKGNHPGYYLHLEPELSFLAGGLYMPPPELLKAVRNEIYFNADEFKSILKNKEFEALFGYLDNFDKLSRPPKGFDPKWPDIDLLKYRSYIVTHNLVSENLADGTFLNHIVHVCRTMHPFNAFLKRAAENS